MIKYFIYYFLFVLVLDDLNKKLQRRDKPTDCQYVSVVSPKIRGISQFHNNITNQPKIRDKTTAVTKAITKIPIASDVFSIFPPKTFHFIILAGVDLHHTYQCQTNITRPIQHTSFTRYLLHLVNALLASTITPLIAPIYIDTYNRSFTICRVSTNVYSATASSFTYLVP